MNLWNSVWYEKTEVVYFSEAGSFYVPANQFRGYLVLAGSVDVLLEVPIGLDASHKCHYPRPISPSEDIAADDPNTQPEVCDSLAKWLKDLSPQNPDLFNHMLTHWKSTGRLKSANVQYDYQTKSQVLVRCAVSGEFIGEEELLANRPFCCSILARQRSLIVFLDRAMWSRLREAEFSSQRSYMISKLSKSSALPPDAVTPAVCWGSLVQFKRGSIISPSSPVEYLHILLKGRCSLLKTTQRVAIKKNPGISIEREIRSTSSLPYVVAELDGSGFPELLGYNLVYQDDSALHSFGNQTAYYYKVVSEHAQALRIPRIIFDNILAHDKLLARNLLQLKSVRQKFYESRPMVPQALPNKQSKHTSSQKEPSAKIEDSTGPIFSVTRPEYQMMFQMNRRAKVAAILESDSPEKFGGLLDPFRKRNKKVGGDSAFQIKTEDLLRTDSKQRSLWKIEHNHRNPYLEEEPLIIASQVLQNSFLLDNRKEALSSKHSQSGSIIRVSSPKSKSELHQKQQSLKTLSRLYSNPQNFSSASSSSSIFQIGPSAACYGNANSQREQDEYYRMIGGFKFQQPKLQNSSKRLVTISPSKGFITDSSGRYYSSLILDLDVEAKVRPASGIPHKRVLSGRLQKSMREMSQQHLRNSSLGVISGKSHQRLQSGQSSAATTVSLAVFGETHRPASTSIAASKVSRFAHNSSTYVQLD